MTASVQARLTAIAQAYELDAVYAFGSRAREVAGVLEQSEPGHPDSDVDVGVQPQRGVHLTARDRVRLTLELEEALAVAQVDVVILPEANPFLAAEVVRGELLYARDLDAEAEIQLYYLRRAGDLTPFFREQWGQLMEPKR